MTLNSKEEKFGYALGLSIAGNLIGSGVRSIELGSFMEGLSDAMSGKKPQLTAEEANKILTDFMQEQQAGVSEANKEEGAKFLKSNKDREGVTTLKSGLQYEVITEGTGAKPKLNNTVRCHYEGSLISGKVFDSSIARNQPAEFPVSGVIQGWVEALQLMNEGSKWRLYVPSYLAYGENGAGSDIGPNCTLIFDVELIKVL